ncbi:hypothetical protein D3C74_383740 [compost metagenome]
MIQLLLVFAVERGAAGDDEVQNHPENWRCCKQNERQPEIQNHRHDDCSNTDKRRPDDQPDQHSHRQLQLVHVIRDPVDQRRGPEDVQLRIRQRGDMLEHLVAQRSTEALGCTGRIILADH